MIRRVSVLPIANLHHQYQIVSVRSYLSEEASREDNQVALSDKFLHSFFLPMRSFDQLIPMSHVGAKDRLMIVERRREVRRAEYGNLVQHP